MTQARVVELNIDHRSAVKLPPVLQAVRHTAKAQITSLVQSLFDNTDDTLFELAQQDLAPLITEARRLGMFAPTYPLKDIA